MYIVIYMLYIYIINKLTIVINYVINSIQIVLNRYSDTIVISIDVTRVQTNRCKIHMDRTIERN